MKISMLMENTPSAEGFLSEHGLSIHIETRGHRILFDMGQTSGFAANAKRLGIDLAAVDVAVLSHGHYDHGGGLETFLTLNGTAPVYVSQYAFDPCFSGDGHAIGLKPELSGHPRLRYVGEQLTLDEELAIYACNERARPFVMGSYGLTTLRDGVLMPDDFRHEQYLLIREQGKRVLISGCSHKGVLNISRWFAPDVLIGGFHFMKVDPAGPDHAVLDQAAQALMQADTRFATCHCTGLAQYAYLKARMGDKLCYLSAGQQITL